MVFPLSTRFLTGALGIAAGLAGGVCGGEATVSERSLELIVRLELGMCGVFAAN